MGLGGAGIGALRAGTLACQEANLDYLSSRAGWLGVLPGAPAPSLQKHCTRGRVSCARGGCIIARGGRKMAADQSNTTLV